ncbi:hypothetical protein C0989_011353 [Termitomyces sp. Mn162]|nr:hypothetical protein C0989_011353 [Termitomyces sp. Mn162]
MPANVQSVAPAWQTAELQDEWIEPEDENGDDEDDNLTYGTRSISLTAPLATHIYTNTKDGGDASLLQPLATGGTFLIREDIPSEPLLVKTPGRPKKGIIKDFFSPLPLERMFEPPSPPQHKSAKAHIPLSNTSQPSHGKPQDEIVETDMPDMNSFHGRKAGIACKFTFAVPRESLCLSTPKLAADADAAADNPQAQSTPYPSFPLTKTVPTTDPRLRLFQFQYDTYTREHLSAMVDSIALNSGTGTTPSPTSVIHLSRVSEDEGSVETMSRLRSAKRVKLSPRSDYGEGASIARPTIESKHQVRVIKPDDSQSGMNTFVRDYEYTSRRPVGTPGGASSTAASYRQQAATLMAQIKNDMKGQKRIFSGSTETSYADDKVSSFSSSADVSRTKSNPKPSRRLPADPDNLVENVARLSMHDRRSFSSSSLHSSQHRTSSSRTASLSSRPLSTLSTAPSSYPSSSLRTTDDLNRFVSSSTASGTTLTSTSGVPSFVKHAGPPHIRTIAPADIPPVPEVYNGMVYDKVMMKWVRSGRCVSEEPSEDPFGDIESLKDESREREGEHDRQVYPGEMSRIEERSEADDEELNSFSTDEPSAYIVDVMTGVDTFEDTIDSADEDENGGFEQYEAGPPPVVVATPQRTPAIRSAMKSTPLHRADRRSVSFSDGRREGPIQGLDDLTGIVQSARSKRIAQLMEALEEDGL